MRTLAAAAVLVGILGVIVLVVLVVVPQGTVVISTGTYTVPSRAVPSPGRWELPVGIQPQAIVSSTRARPLPAGK